MDPRVRRNDGLQKHRSTPFTSSSRTRGSILRIVSHQSSLYTDALFAVISMGETSQSRCRVSMDLLEFLKIVIGIVLGVVFVVSPLVVWLLASHRARTLSNKSTEELKALVAPNPNIVLTGPALQELQSRDIDLAFALPAILDVALSRNPGKNVLFRAFLRQYFQEKLPHIDLSEKQFSNVHDVVVRPSPDELWKCDLLAQ